MGTGVNKTKKVNVKRKVEGGLFSFSLSKVRLFPEYEAWWVNMMAIEMYLLFTFEPLCSFHPAVSKRFLENMVI